MSPGSPGGGRQTSAGAEGRGAFELNLEEGQGILGSKTGRERHLRQGASMSKDMRNRWHLRVKSALTSGEGGAATGTG